MAGKSNTRQPAADTAAGTDSKSGDLEQFRARPDGEALRVAAAIAAGLGLPAPKKGKAPVAAKPETSHALSLLNRVKPGVKTCMIALLAAPGSDVAAIGKLQKVLRDEGATPRLVAPTLAAIGNLQPDATIAGMPLIMFDAIVVVGGEAGAKALAQSGDARHFVLEAFRHLKAIAALGAGRAVLEAAQLPAYADGVATGDDRQIAEVMKAFVAAAEQHRVWSRQAQAESVPA
jgi:catalase